MGERQKRGFGRDPAFPPLLLSHRPGASFYTPPICLTYTLYTHTFRSVQIPAEERHCWTYQFYPTHYTCIPLPSLPYLITVLPRNVKVLVYWKFAPSIFLPRGLFPGAATLTDCQRRRNEPWWAWRHHFHESKEGTICSWVNFPRMICLHFSLNRVPLFCKAMNSWLGRVRCKKWLILRGRSCTQRLCGGLESCNKPGTQTLGKKVSSPKPTRLPFVAQPQWYLHREPLTHYFHSQNKLKQGMVPVKGSVPAT